jgi:hypothetical protein
LPGVRVFRDILFGVASGSFILPEIFTASGELDTLRSIDLFTQVTELVDSEPKTWKRLAYYDLILIAIENKQKRELSLRETLYYRLFQDYILSERKSFIDEEILQNKN